MLDGPITQIAESHFLSLISEQVAESRTLDFKRDAVGTTDEDRREFLKDVSAMANTIGGEIVYGVTDENGVAVEANGVITANAEAEILRLENLLRDGIQPRLRAGKIMELWRRRQVAEGQLGETQDYRAAYKKPPA